MTDIFDILESSATLYIPRCRPNSIYFFHWRISSITGLSHMHEFCLQRSEYLRLSKYVLAAEEPRMLHQGHILRGESAKITTHLNDKDDIFWKNLRRGQIMAFTPPFI
jgi:hypothetical protein